MTPRKCFSKNMSQWGHCGVAMESPSCHFATPWGHFCKKNIQFATSHCDPVGSQRSPCRRKGLNMGSLHDPTGSLLLLRDNTPNLGTRTDEIETEIIHSRSQPRYIPRNFLQIHKEEMDRPRTSNSPPDTKQPENN